MQLEIILLTSFGSLVLGHGHLTGVACDQALGADLDLEVRDGAACHLRAVVASVGHR